METGGRMAENPWRKLVKSADFYIPQKAGRVGDLGMFD